MTKGAQNQSIVVPFMAIFELIATRLAVFGEMKIKNDFL